MEVVLLILIFLLVAGSLIITFVAIIQILSNDFSESKGLWILISMIAFIGPILWLTKGRKLIVKRSTEENLEIKSSFSGKSHYVELIQSTGILLKVLAPMAVVLILLGYLVRAFDLYFFWESKAIGFVLLLITIVLFLWGDIQSRKEKDAKRIWSSIGFGLICFILFVKGLLILLLPNSDAYKAAKEQLRNDSQLASEIGEIQGFTVLPSGSMQTNTNASGTYKAASIELIIKGTNKYIERTISLESTPQHDWTIISINE